MSLMNAAIACSATMVGTVAYAVFVADSLNPTDIFGVIKSEPLLWMIDLVALLVILSYVMDNLVAEPQQQNRQSSAKKSRSSSTSRSNKNDNVNSYHFDLLDKRKQELFEYCKSRYLAKHRPNES